MSDGLDDQLNKTVSSVSRAYHEIIDNEVRRFISTALEQVNELDKTTDMSEDFEIVEGQGGIRGLTTDTEIHYKGELIISVEQNPREDGSFEFEAIRHYEEVKNE